MAWPATCLCRSPKSRFSRCSLPICFSRTGWCRPWARFLLKAHRKSRRKNPWPAGIRWCGAKDILNCILKASGMVTAGSSSSVWRIGFSFRLVFWRCARFVRVIAWIERIFFSRRRATNQAAFTRSHATPLKETQRCVMTSNASSITKFCHEIEKRDRQHRASLQRVQPYLQHFSSHRRKMRTSFDLSGPKSRPTMSTFTTCVWTLAKNFPACCFIFRLRTSSARS